MSVLAYKCPNCGGNLEFSPEKQKMTCEFCLSEFTDVEIEQIYAEREKHAAEQRISQQFSDEKAARPQAAENFGEHTVVYNCSSCGAEIVADDTTAATFCHYCHSPVVIAGKLGGDWCPTKLVPFEVDRETAKKEFLRWASKKFFVPRNFFCEEQISYLAGVYYPFWLTDSDVNARLTAIATNVRAWSSGDYQYTETTTYHIVREGGIHFEDIVTAALKKADKRLLNGILPFPVSAVADFTMNRLSGFVAEKRDIEKESVKVEVDSRIEKYAEKMLRDTIAGYGSVIVRKASCDILAAHWDYTLMPVWTLTYTNKQNGRQYAYALNGVTKAAFGQLPVSIPRLAVLFFSVTAAVFTLLTAIGGFIQ